MSIWRVDPTDVEPHTTLVRWQVMYVVDTEARHLVGWAQDVREGRVSSPVQSWDPATRQAVTRSGRVYELAGPPGEDSEAQYVWQRWCGMHGHPPWRDVTADADTQLPAVGKGTQRPKRIRKTAQ